MKRRVFVWVVSGGLALGAFSARATTLALWPLEPNATGGLDGRCLVNPSGGLDVNLAEALSFGPAACAWQRPPNADPCGHWVECDNRLAAVQTGTSGAFAKLTAATPAMRHAFSLGDFTVEGWIKFDALPTRGTWRPYFDVMSGGVNIMLSIRHTRTSAAAVTEANPDGYVYTFECYYRGAKSDGAKGGDHTLFEVREEEIDAFIAAWHHVAFMVDHSNVNSTKMRIYLDGTLKNEQQVVKFAGVDDDHFALYLGGRASNSISARFDYVRISDTALAPEAFLSYDPHGTGGTRVVAAPETTLAYWKLDPDEKGVLDLRNAVGDYAHLKKQSFNSPPAVSTDGQWSELNAFEPRDGGQDGNGCVMLQTPGMGLKTYGLGARLMPTESFVVEGWFNPEQREGAGAYDTPTAGRLFAVADPDTVWSLQVRKQADGRRVFALEACDDTTDAGGSALASGTFSAVLPRVAAWHHLRLAYDAAVGNGCWTFTFDGVAAGTVENVRAPVYAGAVSAENVYLGSTTIPGTSGRTKKTTNNAFSLTVLPRAANDWVFGLYDNWSVSVGGVACAHWPLDVIRQNGNLWIDGRDTVGTYPVAGLFRTKNEFGNTVKTDDLPTVSNPDRSSSFRGDAAVNAGAATIHNNGFFVCDDPRVLALFGDGTKDLTFEYFQKRAASMSGMSGWEIVLTGDTENFGYSTASFNFSSRNNGFQLWMAAAGITSDKLFQNSLAPVDDTERWHHIALVRQYNPADGKVAVMLYEDGILCATLAGSAKTHALVNLCLFARSGGNRLNAVVDEVRVSRAALAPSQFLNASKEAPVTPPDNTRRTLSYWELDAQAAADLANAVVPACPLAGAATGVPGAAVANILRPDTTAWFDGTAATNVGSVAATAPLTSDHAGLNLELSRPFTVEGWFKPVDPGAAVRDVCCASNAAGDGYWRLCLVRDGTAVRLALQAVSPHAWTLWPVDAAFAADLSPHVGAWTHVALSYDPAVGKGTWTLLINGRDGGTLAQEMSPGLWPWGLTRFTLGSAEGGAFDEWRITRGVLTAKDILYCAAPGLAFVIR